ncbi:unnamed protein product [Thlaspi arvense]|uniref:Fucosyltransferase n=1 Tax=Thlaspi arvense TaxID=13288 RepID=A0AAU9RGH4_THLAR|nr:unnamed protein product [Thlaspi arvense]
MNTMDTKQPFESYVGEKPYYQRSILQTTYDQSIKISGDVFRALGLKIKILITIIFGGLLISSVIFLSFSNIFNNELLIATNNEEFETPGDKLIGGLLTADFDERSCVSRYHQSLLYRKPSPYKPSEYLVSKLRSYEKLHKRCGPGTDSYREATKNLGHGGEKSVGECRYIVWVAVYGLGNRILTLASVFLYALLTERVVLVDQSKDISDLFCEPFPGTSWLLPLDFPLTKQIDGYNMGYSRCYGTMLNNHAISANSTPPHLYLHILHDSRDEDKMFFCAKDQAMIDKVPWLIVKANVYFVPSLWFNPALQAELTKMFPQKEASFHLLGRYLFHPTNQVWGIVTNYYNAHLARADERLGLQIRIFSDQPGYLQHVMDQVLSCTQREKLLPQVATKEGPKANVSETPKLKAVLVTSLYPEYSDRLKKMFSERPSSTGEIIEVYQPSGERYQQTDKKLHDQKALAEMYLLSLTDKIVTSARSTFGYVAHSLGGLKPWLLYQPKDATAPDPPCVRSTSMEPCHLTPPSHGCDAEWGTDSGKVVPFVRHFFCALGVKMKLEITTVTCLVLCSVMLLSFFIIFNRQLLDATVIIDSKDSGEPDDKLLQGLLTADFDNDSCLSRYQSSSLYRKASPYKPSQYLVSRLRSYEMLHKRCGPGTYAYKRATEKLVHEENLSTSVGECRYIVWVAVSGLGNRMLTLTSVFLYALLTERIILIDQRRDISDLFCEPFPGTSWLLPLDFPLTDQLDSFNREDSRCYGTMLKNHAINSTMAESIPSYLCLYLLHDYEDHDKMFFCETDQNLIRQVPWLVFNTNLYFIPSLWLIPSFQTELNKLFPQKETVFHHLSRSSSHYTSRNPKLKAVLVTSLYREYSENLRSMYWEGPSSTGDMVQVYQPSQEMYQQTDNKLHDQKALAEIYLLSLTDNLVTSDSSTFGYVAQGLGGLKPWILHKPKNHTAPDPPCVRAMSMEPCFLRAPLYGCQAKTVKNNPFVMYCEDRVTGLKLVDSADEF